MVNEQPTMQDAVMQALTGPQPGADAPVDNQKSDVKRDEVGIPADERKMAEWWQKEIRADKYYFKKVYERMREDMEYARLGADKKWVDGDNYTIPIINRFINQVVSSLYAKNPKVQAKRKPKLMYQNWDGTKEEAAAALQLVQSGADPTGQAAAVLQDVQTAQNYDKMITRTGKTLEILFGYFTGEDFPDYKKRMKAVVRRSKTVGVGYVEIDFHRAMEPDPDVVDRIGDMEKELQLIESRKADLLDNEYPEDDPRAIELRSMLETLEQEKMKIITEGLVFDFPRSTDIIPHRACTQLSGFIGCDYVTREYSMTPEEIQAMCKIDVSSSSSIYVDGGKNVTGDADTTGNDQETDRGESPDGDYDTKEKFNKKQPKGKCCVWRVLNKKTRQEFWLCDGYPGYLRKPAAPANQVHGFWTIYTLIFNEVEDEKEVFPPSDTNFLKWPQREYNSARQGMREHRMANRPKYFVKKGALEEADKANISTAPAHAVIEVAGIEGNMTIEQLIQPYKGVAIDPNMYAVGDIMKDIVYGVGDPGSNVQQTGDVSATEASIEQQGKSTTLSSNVDDLDEFLSEIARGSSQILLQQMNKDSVMEIVGPGAVWPELNADQISKELFLEVKQGSAGRPNQAAELANLERAMPMLIQIGSIAPPVLAKKYCDLLDLDEEEFIVEGMPSILALNAMAQQHAQAVGQIATNTATSAVNAQHAPPNGAPPSPLPNTPMGGPAGAPQVPHHNPMVNPAMQGPAGANHAAAGPMHQPGPQAAFPAPTTHVQPHPTIA